MRGPHDVGGTEAGPVDTSTHELSFWEKQIDAMNVLLGDAKRGIKTSDVNRFYVESLGHEAYHNLAYYERWTAALFRQVVEKGVLTQEEIDARIAELRERLGNDLAGELRGH
jgi:hypothetical protein